MNAYDQVHYVGLPHRHSHPDRLAAMAALYGLSPASPLRCKVLEIGCTDGGHLIPIAAALPESEFIGIDLAQKPIELARDRARRFGLANIRFEQMDLMELDPSLGEFDFITAHGVYSWVPAEVQDRLLEVVARHLSPNGIGFISYNTHPGCHIREITRGMMQYHTRALADDEVRVEGAKEMVEFAAAAGLGGEEWKTYLAGELGRLNRRRDYTIFHDELSEFWRPSYFHQFVAHARRHGLEFVAESQYSLMREHLAGPPQQVLESLGLDRIERQQYLDFLTGRAFRQSLLCHQRFQPADQARPDALFAMHLSSDAVPEGETGREFKARSGAVLEVQADLPAQVLRVLGGDWPETKSFDRLRELCGGGDRLDFANLLLRLHGMNFLRLHALPGTASSKPGIWPRATNLARHQAALSPTVTSALHEAVNMDSDRLVKLLLLLDGTRDLDGLVRDLGGDNAAADIAVNLDKFARLGLIER